MFEHDVNWIRKMTRYSEIINYPAQIRILRTTRRREENYRNYLYIVILLIYIL
jgi:hypothetical protein